MTSTSRRGSAFAANPDIRSLTIPALSERRKNNTKETYQFSYIIIEQDGVPVAIALLHATMIDLTDFADPSPRSFDACPACSRDSINNTL
jgi:hypothetical protein